jgi:hypothetical protein
VLPATGPSIEAASADFSSVNDGLLFTVTLADAWLELSWPPGKIVAYPAGGVAVAVAVLVSVPPPLSISLCVTLYVALHVAAWPAARVAGEQLLTAESVPEGVKPLPVNESSVIAGPVTVSTPVFLTVYV